MQFNQKKDAFIISPFFDNWTSSAETTSNQYYSTGMACSISKSIAHSRWNIFISVIPRINAECVKPNTFIQAGGALVANYKRNKTLTYRIGVYINNELFGVYVMPLLGIDWNINSRNNLFGLLPGNITYEHMLNTFVYYGVTFRAITNSFAMRKGYWRIDENQMGLYLDFYTNEHIVINTEVGHSVLRKIRTGVKHAVVSDLDFGNGMYCKFSLAYRIRFKRSGLL
jgi:hypothetical protein